MENEETQMDKANVSRASNGYFYRAGNQSIPTLAIPGGVITNLDIMRLHYVFYLLLLVFPLQSFSQDTILFRNQINRWLRF